MLEAPGERLQVNMPNSAANPATAKRKELEITRRRTRIVELRDQGRTFREIAKELGVSLGLVHKDFEAVCLAIPVKSVDAYREHHVARLAKMREVVEDVLSRRHLHVSASGRIALDENDEPVEDDGIVLAAMAQLVKIDEAERKLLGLDARPEVQITGTLSYEILGMPAQEGEPGEDHSDV